jgi:carbon storage regulator
MPSGIKQSGQGELPMLVLSRKRGEKIVVPQCQLSVTVIRVHGNHVRLGISAPPEVAVHREELWREIRDDGFGIEEAAASPDSVDEFAAELSDAAYQSALRLGLADSWMELELRLWRSLTDTVKTLGREWRQTADRREVDHYNDGVEVGHGQDAYVSVSGE